MSQSSSREEERVTGGTWKPFRRDGVDTQAIYSALLNYVLYDDETRLVNATAQEYVEKGKTEIDEGLKSYKKDPKYHLLTTDDNTNHLRHLAYTRSYKESVGQPTTRPDGRSTLYHNPLDPADQWNVEDSQDDLSGNSHQTPNNSASASTIQGVQRWRRRTSVLNALDSRRTHSLWSQHYQTGRKT